MQTKNGIRKKSIIIVTLASYKYYNLKFLFSLLYFLIRSN